MKFKETAQTFVQLEANELSTRSDTAMSGTIFRIIRYQFRVHRCAIVIYVAKETR